MSLRAHAPLACLVLTKRFHPAMDPRIPQVEPFSWDPILAAWDRAILLGHDAWTLTHALFPGPMAAHVSEQIYLVWFFLVYGAAVIAAVMPLKSPTRLAFLLAFGLDWALGGALLAIIFSSAGPVYYERLYADPVFAPLVERLHLLSGQAGLSLMEVVEKLWRGNMIPPQAPPLGISAFPSMHLCMVATVTGFAFSFGRVWGALALLYTAAILFGSVHLGWHYLVDGLAGIALGALFWWISLRFARAWLADGR